MTSRTRNLLRLAVASLAAFGLWVFVVTREIANWPNREAKQLAIVAVGLLFGAFAALPIWRRWRGPWTRGALVVVLAFAAGEARRDYLRYEYAAGGSAYVPISLFHPDTTTDLRVVHYDARLPGLGVPRLRVVQVTDLHITEALPYGYYERLERQIRAESPDLLLFTGDYLSRRDRLPLLVRWLATVPHARYGDYAVLGNHEFWLDPDRVRDVLSGAGIEMLSGTCTRVPLAGSASVRLCGTEAPWGPPLEAAAVHAGALGSAPLIALSHTPDTIYALQKLGAAVVFAGHTHGGQWRLPLIGAVIVPSRYGRRFDRGRFHVDGTDLFVSAGVGADAPPLRIYCPPELVEVDFHP